MRRRWSWILAFPVALAAMLGAAAANPARAQPAPEHECDRLAQPPRQTLGALPAMAEGVAYTALRGPAARAACSTAMDEFPNEARFKAYAGRAADKAGDGREAARLYKLAADQGNALAQNNLAAMYEAGEGGLPRNPREAARLYRLAADQGFPAAQANLGVMYATGRGGLPRDDREAVRLFQLGVQQEDSASQNNLGKMFADGRGGLPRDMRQAAAMWKLAADQGVLEARNNLRRLGR